MLIRKLFKFENAHIVRGCTTKRCASSIHGHSYKVEFILEAHAFDNGQMVYDFGLLKGDVRDLVDAFDHSITLWSGDNPEYIQAMKAHSERWVQIPVSPSAEQFSRLFFLLADTALGLAEMVNGESQVWLQSVIVHETETGYAQCFREDVVNEAMGRIHIDDIHFSPAVVADWHDPELFTRLKLGRKRVNPRTC